MSNILVVSKKKETFAFFAEAVAQFHNIVECDSESRIKELGRFSDLVVIDLTEKSFDVKSVISALDRGCAGIPVIAYFDDGGKWAAAEYSDGIDNYIFKSFSRDEARCRIDRELKGRETNEELSFLKSRLNETPGAGGSPAESGASARKEVLKLFSTLNRDIFDGAKFLNNFFAVFKELSRVSRAAVILREGDEGLFRIKCSACIEEDVLKYMKFSEKEGIIAALSSGLAVLKKGGLDYRSEKEFQILKADYAVPISGKKGLAGALVFNNKMIGAPVTDDELLSYYELASAFADVMEKADSYKTLYMKRHFADNLIDSIKSGVVTVNRDGKLIDINKTACDIFGIDADDQPDIKKGKFPQKFLAMIKDTLNGDREFGGCEINLDGGDHTIEVKSCKIADEEGNLAGASFIFNDPVYEKGIEKEARKAERYEFVNKIALRSSHELRNCLVSIRTFTQLLPEKYVDEQFRKDFYSVVSKEVERLNSLVDKLLFFAQPVTLQYGKANINELIDESLSQTKVSEEATITVNKNFSHQIPFIEIDRELIVKAFANIIQNSQQSMQKGGRLIITTKESEQEGSENRYLTVQFRDTGKGVSIQNSEEVFEPFFSTKSRGLGLGLTIARKIVEEHGGSVRFASSKEDGTEVTIRIPREPRKNRNLKVGSFTQPGKNFIN